MPEYSELEAAWEVSSSTVSREINFMVPLLSFYMQKIAPIEWPGENNVEVVPGLEHHGVSGAIDCTTHYRVTDSYVPHLFFRGDHHACSLTAERKFDATLRSFCLFERFSFAANVFYSPVVVGLLPEVRMWRLVIALGHNCDQRMLTSFGTQELIERDDIVLTGNVHTTKSLKHSGDRGYHHHRVLVPQRMPQGDQALMNQARATVEHVFGLVQKGKTAGGKKDAVFRGSLELHLNCIIFQYHRAQKHLISSPWVKNFE
jgi:hypothetical protein